VDICQSVVANFFVRAALGQFELEQPDQLLHTRDLLQAVRQRLSEEERSLAEQRAQGREWTEIAAACGAGAEALRKQLARALGRVVKELGLEEVASD
jgi:hypothetical protein